MINVNMNNNRVNDVNMLPGSRLDNLDVIRNRNDMYEDLIGSIYDYMIETDYNNIGLVLQSSDDRRRYKVKIN